MYNDEREGDKLIYRKDERNKVREFNPILLIEHLICGRGVYMNLELKRHCYLHRKHLQINLFTMIMEYLS